MNLQGTKRLETGRLILRPYVPEDAGDMFENWASDPEVTKFLTWPTHTGADVSKMVVEDWISHYAENDFCNWAIEWKETGRVIGNISVVKSDEATGSAEVGYALGRAFWGRGIMPEALREVIRYLFEDAGADRVAACHDVNNPKSGRVMDKAGMTREGVLRRSAKNNQGICDAAWHSILRSEWEEAAPGEN